ncbi:MAG: aldose 1-epimerase family protein [Clostridia bacterium]|nr:aldose 1-epimerase family protein [Clostridia bacterium]
MLTELIKKGYIGNPAQLVTLRRVTVAEGKAKGTGIIEVRTAGGLELDLLPDAGLDIGQCRFRGVNMSWMSKNGYDSPAAISPYETEFVNTFPGGLLYTCGLRSAGPANRDNGEWHPLHGRYHSLLADNITTDISGDELLVKGTVRETALFGHVLEVKRTIRIPVRGASVTVEDVVTNQTHFDEEIMQIYHCNFGYPLLSERAKLVLPSARRTIPRTEFAATGLGRECVFDPPVPGEEERVFFHLMERTFAARLENPELGVNMKISWTGDTLPVLSQWRCMAAGDYVLGLEPTNCYIHGRHEERENGTLKVLRAFESVTNKVKIEFSEVKNNG